MMNALRHASRLRQQGIAGVLGVLFLIVAVIFVLSQTLGITGANSIDTVQQRQSAAALFLAESGLETGVNIMANNTISETLCTTGMGSASFDLASGHVDLTGSTGYPAGCNNATGTKCTACTIRSTGQAKVGSVVTASRTLERTIGITLADGTFCNEASTPGGCQTVQLTLHNNSGKPAVAVFNLASARKGASENAACNGVTPSAGGGCYLAWNVNAQNGNDSLGDMGAAIEMNAGTTTLTINQTLAKSTNYAEVGVLFTGTAAAGATTIGTYAVSTINYAWGYWNDQGRSGGGAQTVGKTNDASGQTNDGTATASCASSPVSDPSSNGSQQTCTNWCRGGDMLVFGFAGKSASLSDHIKPNDGGVTFNTIPMKLKVQYPTSTDIGAPVGVDSEIWYLYNPDYSATGASSGSLTGTVGAGVTGTIGATITGVLSTTSTTGTIAKNKSEISGTTGSFSPGQHLVSGPVCTGFTYGPTTTILSINTPGNGNINLTNITQPTVNCTGTFTFSSNVLNVTALTGALFPAGSYSGYGGDTVSGTTISAQLTGSPTGGVGTYTISDSSGFPLTVTNVAVTSNMLKVTSLPTTGTLYPAGTYSSYVYAGDTISGATINSQVTGNPAGGVGTYRLNGAAQGLVTLTAAAVTSPLFNATAASAIGVGDTIAGGTVVDNPTISKVGTVNTYSAPYVLSANEGPTGTTTLKNKAISVPGGTVAPVAGTILAVSTATGGVFPPNTIVLSAATGAPADPTATKFYVSAIPTTVLNNDAICGGTCAFFQHNPAGSMTTFTLDLSTGTGILGNSWASGFTCLKGADGTQETVYVTKLPPNRWTEVIKN